MKNTHCLLGAFFLVSEPMDLDEGPIRSQTVFVIDDDDEDVIQITASDSESEPDVIAVRLIPNPTNSSQRRPTTYAEVATEQLRQRAQPNSRPPRNESRQPDSWATTSSGGGSGSGSPYAGAGDRRTASERARQSGQRGNEASSPRPQSLNRSVQNPIPAGAEVYLVGGTLYREMMSSRAEPDVINLDDD